MTLSSRILILASVLLAVSAPGAWASTAVVDGTTLVYTSAPGETNAVTFEPAFFDTGAWAIQDSAPLTPGAGCTAVSETKVECQKAGITATSFSLGDAHDNFTVSGDVGVSISVGGGPGNDTLRGAAASANVLAGDAGDDLVVGGEQADQLSGGDGDDDVQGQSGADVVDGGPGTDILVGDIPLGGGVPGDDVIRGLAGADSITGGGGNDLLDGGADNDHFFEDHLSDTAGGGSDALIGGPGVDEADYHFRQPAQGTVRVTLDGRANDGQGAEGDNVMPDVENVAGSGAARNVLVGSVGANTLTGGRVVDAVSGGRGNDRLRGNGGRDTLRGGSGRDTLIANDCTRDRVDGGPGRDYAVIDLARRDRVRAIERGRRARCA